MADLSRLDTYEADIVCKVTLCNVVIAYVKRVNACLTYQTHI